GRVVDARVGGALVDDPGRSATLPHLVLLGVDDREPLLAPHGKPSLELLALPVSVVVVHRRGDRLRAAESTVHAFVAADVTGGAWRCVAEVLLGDLPLQLALPTTQRARARVPEGARVGIGRPRQADIAPQREQI